MHAAPSRSRIVLPIVKEFGAFGQVPTSRLRMNTGAIACVLHREVTKAPRAVPTRRRRRMENVYPTLSIRAGRMPPNQTDGPSALASDRLAVTPHDRMP